MYFKIIVSEHIKGTPSLSFCRFSNLDDGTTDRTEIFNTNRTPKTSICVFQKIIFQRILPVFWKPFAFSSC